MTLKGRWPWCWLQACWYTLESTWFALQFVFSLTVTSSFFDLTVLIFSTPRPYLKTWDNVGSLKRLSFGGCQARTAAWTNFVSTSDGLWCVPTLFKWDDAFTENILKSHRCLSSMCFDFLQCLTLMPSSSPADESVLTVILTSLERIADLHSWVKRLIASDSTVAWVIA